MRCAWLRKRVPQVSVATVARGVADGARAQHLHAPHADAAHEVEILHHRHGAVTARLIVGSARNEQALVAVRQMQRGTAQAHQTFERARGDAVVIQRITEGRRGMARGAAIDPFHEVVGLAFPAGVEHRVGVEKQQPRMPRGIGTGAHLGAAIGRGADHLGTRLIGDLAACGRWSRRRPRSPRAPSPPAPPALGRSASPAAWPRHRGQG